MRKLIAAMKISVDEKIAGPGVRGLGRSLVGRLRFDAASRRVRAWGRYVPGYEQYWTSIQKEPDKPVWITGSAPTPA